jgi:hypothetical protein
MANTTHTTIGAVFFKHGIIWEFSPRDGHRLRSGDATGPWTHGSVAAIRIGKKDYQAREPETGTEPFANKLVEVREVEAATSRYDIYPEELES